MREVATVGDRAAGLGKHDAPVRPKWVSALEGIMLGGLAVYVFATIAGVADVKALSAGLYNALVLLAAALCIVRAALVKEGRWGWFLIGLAVAMWAVGDVIWDAFLADQRHPPFPSAADALYLLFIPFVLAGMISLGGARALGRSWLDGLIGALAAATVLAALVVAPAASGGGDMAAVVTNFAYPVGDMFLLAVLISLTVVSGMSAGRSWVVLALGIVMFVVADIAYLLAVDAGTYEDGGWIDPFWIAGTTLIGIASWWSTAGASRPRQRGALAVAIPAILALPAIALLIADHYNRLPGSAAILAGLTLVAVSARFGLILVENRSLVRSMAASVDRYRTLVNTAGEAVVTLDAEGRYTFVNDRFTEITGYERDEVIGHSVLEFVPANSERAELDDRLEAEEDDGPERLEVEVNHKDGSTLWLLVNSSPMLAPTTTRRSCDSRAPMWPCSRTSPTATGPSWRSRRASVASASRSRTRRSGWPSPPSSPAGSGASCA